ncbi:DUF637 domain-containing protein [Rhodoferax mekongensis]|uniref:DUF637 domain-containing protein n=1 Tax=Rhodoferax mekongensis TaxID=3068341 RepID=A0ABZ0AZS7_9BURK|nr:DUF637 domain-containing protein [Rhodoferax sp. TBRC 17307]WNO04234.1 DUF637 domain-containing protein [Rhodoferax sp. TBRC 17307]
METDPRFTNYRAWLSSDYITTKLALDPTVTQKRLGDGFYEQKLIREQVAQLTGRRFLGDYTSDQQQYQALMDSGLTFAKTFNLRPGIALTANQLALLTTDIVWLQQETVTLADGTQTQVLVPHVYAAVKAGDLTPNGALLSGDSVAIQTTGDITNAGTILGRKVVQIEAGNIHNLAGLIQAQDVALQATQDINNTGGSVVAGNSLVALAGRDLNVASTTASSSGSSGAYSYTQTGIDRIAGFYVQGKGVLYASAGNDFNATAAQIAGNGAVQLSAANNVNINALKTSQTNNLNAGDAKNHLLTSQTSDAGSTISSGTTLTVNAGNSINAKAASLSAADTATLAAKGNIVLDAGQTQSSYESVQTSTSSGLLSSTTTSTQTQASAATAQVSTINAKNISVIAEQNLVSVGTEFKGSNSVTVEGKDTTTLYAATNTRQSTTTTQSTTTLGGAFSAIAGGITLEDKTSTDSTATASSIGTRLISNQKVVIGVGNKTELRGTEVEAPQIAFVKTDPGKKGELILGGSIDTTQTSHTEKTETAGVYQEMKGHGSTTQTLNQTSLKGNVAFDSALKISAQIPDTKGGQALKSQINALASQSGGTGLEYLNQLAQRTDIQWDKVALANEKWSYSQAGLTPAGAALLSIAVAAYMPGASGMFGTTTATGTTLGGVALTTTTAAGVTTATFAGAALNAGFTALASQAAVAMVNNKGDIGKTLEQLGKEESIKNLLTTMVTAGALDKLNSTMGWNSINAKSTFVDQFQKNLGNNLATDMMNSALAGKPFDENTLANSLKGALINTGMAQGANEIGNAYSSQQSVLPNLNDFTHKLAHAVLGCAAGAATAGNGSGCTPGAVGAVVGELTAEYAKKNGLNDTQALGLAKIIAATSGVIVGGRGDNAAAVNIAALTGENAAQNNYLNHAEILRKKKLQADITACGANTDCAAPLQVEINKIEEEDKKRDAALAAACGGKTPDISTIEQKKVRSFAADVILKGDKDIIFGADGKHTLSEAMGTFDKGRLLVQTAKGTFVSVWDGYIETLKTGLEIAQDPVGSAKKLGAQAQVAAQDAKEALEWIANNPIKFKEIAQAAENQLRNDLANAIQNGDESSIGQMLGDVLANFSPDPLKKVKALNKVVDEVKLAKKAEALAARADVDKAVVIPAGSKGNWSPQANGRLDAKTAYIMDNGHSYITDASGRVKGVEADLTGIKSDRNGYQQACVGKCGNPGDEGGHLIAASLGGAGDRINIVPQASTLNRGEWKAMEAMLKNEIDAGKKVSVKIDVGYPSGNGARPNVFLVTATINGKIERFPFTQ